MRILIVGSGCSGIYLSCLLSYYKKDIYIDVIDKELKPGKKFLVTGNGRCNLGNLNITKDSFNNEITSKIVSEFDISNIISFLNKISIETSSLENLIYPYSFSSANYRDNLIAFCLNNKNVHFLNEVELLEYSTFYGNAKVLTSIGKHEYDKIIFATGGKSSLNNKKPYEIPDLLQTHGYEFNEFKPGLAPIITNEKTKSIENIRIKCIVSLKQNNEVIYKEKGEVLFKKDGLSGISIFNCCSIIQRNSLKNSVISLDLYPTLDEEKLFDKLLEFNKNSTKSLLNSFFMDNLSKYILTKCKINKETKYSNEELKKIAHVIKNLEFSFKSSYDFKYSQVSIGGIKYSNLNIETLESLIEKNVYFIGEILDSDGLCGGFNLMFAFASAYRVFKNL